MSESFSHRARRLRWLLSDVDGVLTDGCLSYGSQGEELKKFNVRDGLAVKIARSAGLKVGLLSSRSSPALERRATELGLDLLLMGEGDKGKGFGEFLAQARCQAEDVAYAGDDLPDLVVLAQVGLSFSPSDAAPEVRERVDRVLRSKGGEGALREIVELILKARGEWESVVGGYLTNGA